MTLLSESELREINKADSDVRKIIIKLINYVTRGEPSGSTRLNPKQAEEAIDKLITQYGDTREREGRIDEAAGVTTLPDGTLWSLHGDGKPLRARLAELDEKSGE